MAASSPSSSSSSRKSKTSDWRLLNRPNFTSASSSASADVLMAQIDSAIAAVEYVYATHYLRLFDNKKDKTQSAMGQLYDAQAADEAYRSGCAAIARGEVEVATHFLEVALAKCPPHKTRAISKVQSLLHQVAKPPNQSFGP